MCCPRCDMAPPPRGDGKWSLGIVPGEAGEAGSPAEV